MLLLKYPIVHILCILFICDGLRGLPTDIDRLKKDYREMDYLVVEKLELADGNKRFLIDAFYDFDRTKLQPNVNESWCTSEPVSAQQLLFNIYNVVALAQFKCYFMVRFKNLLGNHFEDDTRVLFKAQKEFQKSIKGLSLKTDIRRCDPKRFIRGQNYLQFTKLLQGFILNLGEPYSVHNYEKRCSGTVVNCMVTSSTGKACVSRFPSRRYDFIEITDGTRLGKLQYCPNSSILHWQNQRAICLCDQQGNSSDRYISLRKVISNVKNNRVITGIRFVKPSRIVHLQIQEGKLLPNAYIDQSTVRWVPVEEFNITDHGSYSKTDFFLLTNNLRTVAIDEIKTDQDNFVITGIGFTLPNEKLQLEIQVTEFDWTTGTLNNEYTKSFGNYNTNRRWFTPTFADIPTYTDRPSEMWTSKPLFVNFTNTDLEKDAAQTTVPFLDAQEVTSVPAMPLIGAGLYYKGRIGYGGFIAPVIKTYDYLKKSGTL